MSKDAEICKDLLQHVQHLINLLAKNSIAFRVHFDNQQQAHRHPLTHQL